MNRVKPYLIIIFVLWPITTFLGAYLMHAQTSETILKINASERLVANVYDIKSWESGPRRGSQSEFYWAYYRIPTSQGLIEADGPISKETYSLLKKGSKKTLDVYVGNQGSWPAESWDDKAMRVSWENWFIGAVLGLVPAPFLYYVISLIPFGSSAQSLRKRWKS